MSSRLASAFTSWLGEVFCELSLPLVISDQDTPASESEWGWCSRWHRVLRSCMPCQVRVKPATTLGSKIMPLSILLAPVCLEILWLGFLWMKQGEVYQDFRELMELDSYSHTLSEVNLIQGVSILTKVLHLYLSLILHFESGGEELHKTRVTFQPAMALFRLQVSNLADKSLGSLGRDGTRL